MPKPTTKTKKPHQIHGRVDQATADRLDRVATWLCAERCPGLRPRRSFGVVAALLRGLDALEIEMTKVAKKSSGRR